MASRTYDRMLLLLGVLALPGSRPVVDRAVGPPPPPVVKAWRDALAITVVPPAPPAHRWPAEVVGQVTLGVELALAELEGVVPRVAGQPVRPGFAQAVVPPHPPWLLTLAVEAREDDLRVRAELCDPDQACAAQEVATRRPAPEAALASLAGWVGARVGRVAVRGMGDVAARGTRDPYASLIGGRSAATWLSLLPEPSPEARGDVRRDPFVRAVHLDPELAVGWVVWGRVAEEPETRELAAREVARRWPHSVPALADLAVALEAAGQPAEAADAWREVGRRQRGDPRFVVPRIRAALQEETPVLARAIRSELDGAWIDDVGLARVEVELAEAEGTLREADLERWAHLDAANPEPLSRRVALLTRQGRAVEALALLPALAERGRPDEAARLTVGLASSLGRWEEAATAARSLGADEAASRLSAAREGGGAPEDLDAAVSPEARLVRAARLLERGRAVEARRVVDEVLVGAPWWPEALDLSARSLEAVGEPALAEAARARLRFADPTWPGWTP